jgi:hypothetical protein
MATETPDQSASLAEVSRSLFTNIVGVGFTRYIPNVHLSEFADALHRQEILLMVDVPAGQVARVEKLDPPQSPRSYQRWRRLAPQRVADLARGLPDSATDIDASPC